MKPIIVINFKTYAESSGDKALSLAQDIATVRNTGYTVAIAPSLLTLREVAERISLPIFAQHADPVLAGAHTGSISLDELVSLGVMGTIINHSERKIPLPILQKIVKMCREKQLLTIVCASTLAEVRKVAKLHPDFLAYEPTELIGGNISVTNAKPEIITKAVKIVAAISPNTKVLCGAGITSCEDVQKALELGTHGVLLAHIVAKAKNPKKVLEGLLG